MSSTLTINSNLASLNAQRRLDESTQQLGKSFERLSSGLRINRASDDAAGLAIASSLNVDSRVYSQAVRNTNDAISLYSIAEGSLTSLVDVTTRLKELGEQSSNGVLTYTQRKALDSEAQALGKEYQRIVNTTQFNGQNLINGNGPLNVQAGYSALTLTGGNTANGSFAAATSYAAGPSPYFVTTADLNGDGNADLIEGDFSAAQVDVLLGNGDGSFKAKRANIGIFGNIESIVTADVNGDGILDMVSAQDLEPSVSVFIGNGDGTFKQQQAYTSDDSSFTYGIAAADVNGDSFADLITANTFDGVTVLLGNGNGTFRSGYTFAASNPSTVAAQDLNGDGIIDLIATHDILLGNGDGTFKTGQALDSTTTETTAVDVNGDGLTDLVSVDYGSQVFVSIGNGNGTFKVARTYAGGSSPQSVVSADVNWDGVADLIVNNAFSSQLGILVGNGDGTFKAAQTYSAGVAGIFHSLATADFNSDGIADLVTSDEVNNTNNVLLGNGSPKIASAPSVIGFSLLTRQSSLQALTQFGKVLDRLTASLGQVGASESRLQTVTNVLQQTRITYANAASQILDVDVAAEAANLAKGNILQQAGAAVLAQANQQPALSLRLLQGIR